MSDVQTPLPEPVQPKKINGGVVVVMVLLVLALAGATARVFGDISNLRSDVASLQDQLERSRNDTRTKAAAIEAAISPLAIGRAKAAQVCLDAGDEDGAKAELAEAQVLAMSVRDLGTGSPPADLVAVLTDCETTLGQPISLAAPAVGGT